MEKSLRSQVVEFAIHHKDKFSWKEIAEQFNLSTDEKTLKRLSDWTRYYFKTGLVEPLLDEGSFVEEIEVTEDSIIVPEGMKIKSAWQNANGKMLYSYEKIKDDSAENIDFERVASIISRNVLPTKEVFSELKQTGSTKMFCISDMHVGMKSGTWNLEESKKRFLSILDYTDNCEDVIIKNYGDIIDGLDSQTATTTSNHILPQNMNNEEQIIGAVQCFQLLFDGLHKQVQSGKIKSFKYITVQDSNHSGEMEVLISKFLKMWLEVKYPYVEVIIPEQFWGHINVRGYNILYSHGKNSTNHFKGCPLNLDLKHELLIAQELQERNIPLDARKTLVISGDLHQMSSNQGKFFKYFKLPSAAPSSQWVKDNFGAGVPAIQYFNLSELRLETGFIEF